MYGEPIVAHTPLTKNNFSIKRRQPVAAFQFVSVFFFAFLRLLCSLVSQMCVWCVFFWKKKINIQRPTQT